MTQHAEAPKSGSCEFRIPPESYPTKPSRFAAAIQLLSWTSFPFSTSQPRRSTGPAGFQTCLRSAFRVWYPLDGLLPPPPGEPYFMLTALLGFSPSKLSRPQGIAVFPPTINPPDVPLTRDTSAHADARQRKLRLLGFSLASCLGCLNMPEARPHQVAPLEFSLLGFFRLPTLVPLRGLSSHVLDAGRLFLPSSQYALQSVNRSATGNGIRCRNSVLSVSTLLGFLRLSILWH